MRQSYYMLSDDVSLFDVCDKLHCHPYIFNVIKYIVRCGKKSALQQSDLEKALEYLNRYMTVIFANNPHTECFEYDYDLFKQYIEHAPNLDPWARNTLRFIVGHCTMIDLQTAKEYIEKQIKIINCAPQELLELWSLGNAKV